jgi:hypothetical protein
MNKSPMRGAAALLLLLAVCVAAIPQNNPPSTDGAAQTPQLPAAEAVPSNTLAHATAIIGLCDDAGKQVSGKSAVGLNDLLWVVVITSADPPPGSVPGKSGAEAPCSNPTAPASASKVQLDASQYALFFNGRELEGLDGTVYDSARHALGFRLARNDQNKAVWARLLGSPTTSLHRSVSVALGERKKDGTPEPGITGIGNSATFGLRMFSQVRLGVAVAAIILVLYVVWGHARSNTTLRDNLLPQLVPDSQPYSLGRWQMAFWFVLIFASFIFLYCLLGDYNTVSNQALGLMGISAATALAAVAVDDIKNSPADDANRALRALGLNTYADVLRLREEIAVRKTQLPPAENDVAAKKAAAEQAKAAAHGARGNTGPAATAKAAAELADSAQRHLQQLQGEIQDRNNILRTYDDKSRPFVTQGWFKDITTDINGPTVHRVQVLCWTVALGIVFLIGVYRDLAMPADFSGTLLALMGISSAGYVGFKYPEKNN